jgi:hypothetical protein
MNTIKEQTISNLIFRVSMSRKIFEAFEEMGKE